MSTHTLPVRHLLLALAVVAIWGSNFVVIKVGLAHLPPFLFAALRFTLVALPLVFVLPRPAASWRNLAAYGVLIGAGQFGLLFFAMRDHISPGLASLVIQMQVFFTIFLSMTLAHEKVHLRQWLALLLAATGIGVIAWHTDGSTTVAGVALVLLAALCWAGGNMVSKRAGRVNMVAYVAWSSLFAAPPLFVLSLLFEGSDAIVAGVRSADWATWGAVLWQSVGNSLFGYAAWGWLLARHPAATITPMALLVPVFGMAASAWWLGEAMPLWKFVAMGLVMAGLAMNFWSSKPKT
ncbi:MAG: EamA family transporter [Betaproteobacteria bacterium]|nr:EamA family transporter [Betaproteobacteria bacterium]